MTTPLTYKFPPPGDRINIGKYALHAHQMGSGSPTVLFEAGLGSFGLQWLPIQSQIAQFTHTLSYDRAGLGWSDPSPYPRTPQQLTEELHCLLEKLHLTPPYILVAHSFGGLICRYFTRRYPDEVQAMVLVDTSHEMQLEKIKNYQRMHTLSKRMMLMLSFMSRSRFIGRVVAAQSFKEVRADISDDIWQQFISLAGSPAHYKAIYAEMACFEDFFGPTHSIPRDFGDLPLTVITAEESMLHQRSVGGISAQELNQAHLENQAEIAGMSTNGQHIVVPQATHLSISSNPVHTAAVVNAIRQLLPE